MGKNTIVACVGIVELLIQEAKFLPQQIFSVAILFFVYAQMVIR